MFLNEEFTMRNTVSSEDQCISIITMEYMYHQLSELLFEHTTRI